MDEPGEDYSRGVKSCNSAPPTPRARFAPAACRGGEPDSDLSLISTPEKPVVASPASAAAATYTAAKGAEPVWTTGNKQTDSLIRYYGGRYGVDPYLIFCVMRQESGFRTAAAARAES